MRRAERLRFPDAPGGNSPAYHLEHLALPIAEPRCQADVAEFHPVAPGEARPHEHAGVEMIYVLSGELGVCLEEAEHVLAAVRVRHWSSPHPDRLDDGRRGARTCAPGPSGAV